jgi:glycosyltransferase involved in cell wall biosynthesis
MKIGVNVSWMTPGQAGGMEWYVRHLIEQLGVIDNENEYLLVAAPNNYKTFKLPSPRWKKIIYMGFENSPMSYRVLPSIPIQQNRRFPLLRQLYRTLKSLPAKRWSGKLSELMTREGIDIWFCPFMFALPIDTPVPTVITIPDLQHEYYPHFFSEYDLALRNVGYQYSCKIATATIGISHYVAHDIVRLYGVEPDRVFGIPLGLDPSYQLTNQQIERELDRVRLKYRLDPEFIFFPANGWRHKNHENLIKALGILHEQGRTVQLVLTGCPFDLMDRMKPLLHSYGLSKSVRHLGYVDRHDLIGLYAASKMLVFPSLFEGFGLPLLEAMCLGTPVVCSRIGSLPDVGGDAVLYVDPHSPEDIAQAMLRMIGDDGLRHALIESGKERVKQFSYLNTAQRTLSVFKAIRDGVLVPPDLPSFRPLIAHNWLREGHSRWYFRSDKIKSIELKVAQPLPVSQLTDQTVRVALDEQLLLETVVEPQQVYDFSLTPTSNNCSGFHRLDIVASAIFPVSGEILSLQVISIDIIHVDGSRTTLVS